MCDKIENAAEIWRDIVGFEGCYQVSNLGRVKILERILSNGDHIKENIKALHGSSYQSVMLGKDGQTYNKLVHRLVAEAFIPNPDNLPEVNHKDNNPKNNRVDNLEWVTAAQNSEHRIKTKKNYSYRKSVKCLETGQIFSSISAAGKSVDASTQQVIDSIRTERCCKGMTFVYTDNIPNDTKAYMERAHSKYQTFHRRPSMRNAKKVVVLETGQIFDSMGAAARFYQCDTTTIYNRVKANKSFNGSTLQFIDN